MKALARYGKAFGGYRLIDVPVPEVGDEDILVEVRAAMICGADMKHFKVNNGSDEFNSIRGHEFAGEIVKVGSSVKDWHVGQRIVSDNTGHVCGVCQACEQADFLVCENKTNIGLDNNRWGGGFTKYVIIPGIPAELRRTREDWLKLAGFFNELVPDGNNPNYSSAFGTPVSQAGGVFGSGGPRAFQLAAKVTF